MANLSDAFGTITVEKVASEFLDYAKIASKNYYNLADSSDLESVVPDDNNSASFSFSTFGRWSFCASLENYLDPAGIWHQDGDEKVAYERLSEALLKTNGQIVYEYTDSDSAMGWMGTGVAQLEVVDGELRYTDNFDEEDISIRGYADLTGNSIAESIDILYSYEASEAWVNYVEKCEKEGVKPADPDMWFNDIYEEE